MIKEIPTRCSFLFSLFDGKTQHVSSVTRSSSGVSGTVFAARCRIQLFLIHVFVVLNESRITEYDTWLQTQFLNS